MDHNQKRKEEIRRLFKENDNFFSVGYGRKIVNGEKKSDKCIIFGVEKKLPIDQLSPEEIIPKNITIDDVSYLTDVIECPKFMALACDTTTQNQCVSRVSNVSNRWNPTLIPNRLTQRPLKGGCCMARSSVKGSGVGTFGFIAVDSETQSLVGVTNNHVAARIGFITSDFPSNGNIYYNTLGEEVYQTGEPLSVITDSQKIGRIRNYYPLSLNSGNYIDGATIVINQDVISNSESFNQVGLPFSGPFPFATSEELDDLVNYDTLQIASAGRSTGVKYSGECPIEILSVDQSVYVGGYDWFSGGERDIEFLDCIIFERSNPDCLYPIYGGDSGSGILGFINGQWKIIGLCFAGSNYTGIFSRIDHVASLLGIEAWDGSPKNYLDGSNPQLYYSPGLSNQPYIIIDGKKYWQVGLSNN
jgi:hypothetical protein